MKTMHITALTVLALAPLVIAQDGAREKIRELENKAGAAQAEGRADEAEKLRGVAREFAERAKAEAGKRDSGRPASSRREELRSMLEKSRRDLDEATKSGQGDAVEKTRQHISRLERMLHSDGEKGGSHAQPEMAGAQRRLQHLGQAIEHLRAAGLNEPAERLSEQARMMRKELARQESQGNATGPDIGRQLSEIREGMQNLQRQVQEMNKRLEELTRDRK